MFVENAILYFVIRFFMVLNSNLQVPIPETSLFTHFWNLVHVPGGLLWHRGGFINLGNRMHYSQGRYFGQKPPSGLEKIHLTKKQGRNSAASKREIPKILPVFA